MSDELVPVIESEMATSLAKRYGLKAEAFVSTMRSVAMPKGHTTGELFSCLIVAAEHQLNPLTKEIYFMRTKAQAIQPIVSVDGWIRIANSHPQYDGCEFETVRGPEGQVVAMRCSIFRKDRGRPTTVEEDLEECSKGGGPVWKSHPNRMLRNRTFCQAARLAFGFAGLMEPDEFRQWQENPEINGGELAPIEAEIDSPRDGGAYYFKGEPIKRPSRQTAIDTGLQDQHHELITSLESGMSLNELHECFDAFEIDGCPWGKFPRGWAVLLHEAYHYALKDALGNEPEDDSDDEAVMNAIQAAETTDALNHLWECWTEDEQDRFRSAYMDRYNELEPTLI